MQILMKWDPNFGNYPYFCITITPKRTSFPTKDLAASSDSVQHDTSNAVTTRNKNKTGDNNGAAYKNNNSHGRSNENSNSKSNCNSTCNSNSTKQN